MEKHRPKAKKKKKEENNATDEIAEEKKNYQTYSVKIFYRARQAMLIEKKKNEWKCVWWKREARKM